MQYKNNSSNVRLLPYIILVIFLSLMVLGYYIAKLEDNFTFSSLKKLSSISKESIFNHKKIYSHKDDLANQKVIDVRIVKGDTMTKILMNNGVDYDVAQQVADSLNKLYNLKKLYLGQQLSLVFDRNIQLDQQGVEYQTYDLVLLKIKIDNFHHIEIARQSDKFIAKKIPIALRKYVTKIQGVIDSSFIATANKLGIASDSLIELTKYYSYDVDFQRDIKNGDEINVVFERYYDDKGNFSHDGDILFSSLQLGEKKLNLYRYPNTNGDMEYFSEDGFSVKKELLRTPLNVAKISSGFGVRKHPVLGYSAMHKGIDFAAPTGTPIFAAGSGVVEEMGHKGSYGNYIRIRHANGYSTAYAHASSFAKKVTKGSRVKQGDVIAYVGSTGRSTGAHLHYEVLINNQHVNPLKIKSTPNVKLSGSEFAKFTKHKTKIEKLSESISDKEILAASDI